ncbi:thioesterase family protein [Saccharopolyspora indica]|uniref:thioesterase family protein n=1 Tax=Saccharopolyspora indica TaxID=1229659 RepID=UPI0022EB7ACA|nr:thioesterase family protein [Saccharopolyspora indica]MDA3649903.1 thioesterase family protein [Saccharopolyspora indica]
MRDTQALFSPVGDQLVPSEAACSPWGELVGGGPVAGLLARAVERTSDDPDLFIARLTVDLMRPVPAKPLTVTAQPLRTGKRLQVSKAVLTVDGKPSARATAQLLRRGEVDGVVPDVQTPFAGPTGLPDGHLLPPELGLRWGVHDVIQVRWLEDQRATSTSKVWMHMPVPLVPGEALSPLSHVAVLVDCISAASPVGPIFGPWINTDITLYLHRPFEGEWLGMEIDRDVQPTGIGVANARLYDERGLIGSAHEAVMVNQLG